MPAIALSELRLSHFRSHRATRLELDARPVALFGHNGTGKTNLLEAVSLLSPGRGLRRAAADDLARRPEALGWKIAAVLSAPDGSHEVETRAEPGQSRTVRVDGKLVAQVALGRLLRTVWLTPAMDRLWTEGAEWRRRFLDRIVMSLMPDHADVSLSYEKAMRDRNRLFRDEINDAAWHSALESQMARAGAKIAANRRRALDCISDATEATGSVFPAARLGLIAPEGVETPESEDELAAALARGRGRDMAAGRTLIGPHRADLSATYIAKGMPAAQCSTGEQKALLISIVLANARAITASYGAPPILLLDEVAAHLDAARRAALYDEIIALGAQAWMTGTGPELFEGLRDKAQLFEVSEGSDGTRPATWPVP